MAAPFPVESNDIFAQNTTNTFDATGMTTTNNAAYDDAWTVRESDGIVATDSSQAHPTAPRWGLQTDVEKKASETHVSRLESKLQVLLDRSRERYRPSQMTDQDSAIGSEDDQSPSNYNPDENDEGLYLLWKAHIKRNRPPSGRDLAADSDDDYQSSSSAPTSSESDDDDDDDEEAALEEAKAKRKTEGQYTWGWMWDFVSCCFSA